MIESKYYVYEWYINETGEVFYVGKGSGNRVTSMKGRNDCFRKIKSSFDCSYKIVKRFSDEKEAYDFEKEYGLKLKSIGQCKACYEFGNENKFIEPSVLKKLERTHFKKGIVPWNTGMKMNNDFVEKCVKRSVGKKQSEETKKKRSESLMNHEVSAYARKKISESRKKKIVLLNTENGTENIFSSISELAELFNVTQSALTPVIKNKRHYKHKYYISYANTEITT